MFYLFSSLYRISKMMEVKRCCLVFTPKTGTIILGTLGVIVFTLYLIPQTVVLKNHDYHMNQFVRDQRLDGGEFYFYYLVFRAVKKSFICAEK